MIVLDASALIDVLLRAPGVSVVDSRLFQSGRSLHAPHLIDVEIAHALRHLALRGEIDADRGRDALTDLADLPIRRYPHGWLLESAWALRANVTACDAVYVALAEALDATLLTRDRRLAAAVGHLIAVEVI